MMERLDAGVFFGRPKVRLALDGLRVTESVYREGLDLPRHSHVAAHFCFVLEGAYVERLGAKAHERVPESLVWHPAGTSHSERHQTIGRHLIEIASERLETLDLPSSDIDAPRQVEGAEASWLIRRVERETRDPDSASALAVEGAVIGLIAETARRREPRGRQDEPRWMRRVDELLRERIADAPTLAEIADAAGVHPSHLARTWRRRRGRTLGEEHRRLRAERARQLLVQTDRSLSAIAHECGFVDQSHLTRVFKRQIGLTPGAFRRSVGRRA